MTLLMGPSTTRVYMAVRSTISSLGMRSPKEKKRNHRFVFSSRSIDLLRIQPENDWDIDGMVVVLYYLFPNIQITVPKDHVTLFKIYPDKECIGRSSTRVCNYLSSEI